jgi:hypothetical protein
MTNPGRRGPTDDGSAGDADYGTIGVAYSHYRQPDPRIARRIHEALGPARTVLNLGAGAGSYEPLDREVTPVEPSASMRAHRAPGLPTAVDGTAEDLPFRDDSFDATMTTITAGDSEIRQRGWPARRGASSMRRCTDASKMTSGATSTMGPGTADTEG